ncbi:BrnT family toxin [Echinimonas agarilytica]|uniref:BrnT family toxin n=1 Tax=Echinimonas agarilytica TaxID=1215918 RepID=A0AA42B9S9_9GAMM|nr:BrnT family toxin [Echinimonas agarilytica]MCM2681266.1 BrnT family toxin [Echinimonas agarilytica]
MSAFNFEWDPDKAESNFRKHGISFEEAESVFFDEFARLISDPDSSVDEERFILMGLSSQWNTLVVCHCYRDLGNKIRIISARKAEKRERKQYEGFRHA